MENLSTVFVIIVPFSDELETQCDVAHNLCLNVKTAENVKHVRHNAVDLWLFFHFPAQFNSSYQVS